MSITQDIARSLLPDRVFASMREASCAWAMRCPCGAETSVWEMGGLRWKATGEPRRMGTCGTCGRTFWGQLYQRDRRAEDVVSPLDPYARLRPVAQHALEQTVIVDDNGRQQTASPQAHALVSHTLMSDSIELEQTAAVLLWIDGVGSWIVFPGEQITIGGPVEPGSTQQSADLCVLANLRRLHATLERTGETWRMTSVDNAEATYLRDGTEIAPGGRLTMTFRTPSVLSPTAVLVPAADPWPRMFTGGRTPATVDGVVLMDEVCLLGPGSDAHIPCREWESAIILFRRNGQLWVRSQTEIEIDGQPADGPSLLGDGSVVSSEQWRFRVEAVPRRGERTLKI